MNPATHRTVLFVCLHGAAKSVLAAEALDRLARARGLDLAADFAGTEPDGDVAPAVRQTLGAEGVDLRGKRPRRVTAQDVAGAWRVITFGCELGVAAAAGAAIERWDDVPAVSADLPLARAAIEARVRALVDEAAVQRDSKGERTRPI
jgi:arsenate reductase